MTVRAKFRCTSKVEREGDAYEVTLSPVMSGSDENKQFYKWTPSGSCVLGTINPEAAALFKPGEEYYVDFTPAPKPE